MAGTCPDRPDKLHIRMDRKTCTSRQFESRAFPAIDVPHAIFGLGERHGIQSPARMADA